MDTVWVFGDQLNRSITSLADRDPTDTRVLLVESVAKVGAKRWHRQRLHVVLTAMTRFAAELADEGFAVDHRRADTLALGLAQHRREFAPDRVVAMAPMSWDGVAMLHREEVDVVANDQFLCPAEEFAAWMDGRSSPVMEDFYRRERRRLGVLMDGDEPAGGRWNYDDQNREPPPTDGRHWPEMTRFPLDEVDRQVLARLPDGAWGADPDGWWPTSREQALIRLDEFVERALPVFGDHEDAMLAGEWKLAHSLLSCPLNLGLLHPAELIEAAEGAYRRGSAPINAAEGFIRQVMGWREYVWGLYGVWMPGYRNLNGLEADRPLPPALSGEAGTDMACLADVMGKLEAYGWAHHIERLMVLGNLCLLAGVRPQEVVDWMWASFVDGAEWVMLPNVLGMALYADGGRMATKPYAAGGAYIDRMSDHCRGCRYDRKRRTGPDACPFTTLYWDFLARHRDRLGGNHRLARQLASLDRLADLEGTRERAVEVLGRLDAGDL
jgi:deoxyribodipyrimidine photolyase-related protein